MHKYEDAISDFIGKDFTFKIKYQQRPPKLDSTNNIDKDKLIKAYANFSKKIHDAEDIKIWEKVG